jgi:hypothetical protein
MKVSSKPWVGGSHEAAPSPTRSRPSDRRQWRSCLNSSGTAVFKLRLRCGRIPMRSSASFRVQLHPGASREASSQSRRRASGQRARTFLSVSITRRPRRGPAG